MTCYGTRATFRAALGALFIATASGACSTTPHAVPVPRLEVTQLSALQGGATGQRFRVDLLVDNLDSEPLPIKEVRFTLRIQGQGTLTGKSTSLVTVQALDRGTLQVEVEGDALASMSQLRAAAAPGNTLGYEIYGNMTLDRAFMATLPFTATGNVPLGASPR